ncbi:MAG: hypothetical protein PXX83_08780 [Candidatus Nitrosotalea sp.]|nr:hypothetical protein [Candidatus Nitrosotalea sp.]
MKKEIGQVEKKLRYQTFIEPNRLSNMVLEKKDKKILDTMIEEEISKIPGLVKNIRIPQFQEVFQIANESEYVYGYTHGSIIGKFETYYFVVHSGKKPTGAEVDEIGKTIFEKSGEIRDAISKTR